MGQRRKASDVARPSISRRALIGVAGLPLADSAGASDAALNSIAVTSDGLVSRCAAFLAVDLRIERLTERWGDLETAAMSAHKKWWGLTEDQRRAIPEGREMAEIDEALKGLFRERERLLTGLPELAVRGADGLLGKLVVAARAIRPEDEPVIHRLLADAARDLAHMQCPECNRPFTLEDVRQFVETLG